MKEGEKKFLSEMTDLIQMWLEKNLMKALNLTAVTNYDSFYSNICIFCVIDTRKYNFFLISGDSDQIY